MTNPAQNPSIVSNCLFFVVHNPCNSTSNGDHFDSLAEAQAFKQSCDHAYRVAQVVFFGDSDLSNGGTQA